MTESEDKEFQERMIEKYEILRQAQNARDRFCQNCREPLNGDILWIKLENYDGEEEDTTHGFAPENYCAKCIHLVEARFRPARRND